jgi:ribosome-associated protein
MIAAGEVLVDGVVETRKACKIRGGQVVRVADDEVRVVGRMQG